MFHVPVITLVFTLGKSPAGWGYDMTRWNKSSSVRFVFLAVTLLGAGGESAYRPALALARISQNDARQLAQTATTIYPSDLIAVGTAKPLQSDFYGFSILYRGGNDGASPNFGAFEVNAFTGDVWNMAGDCTHLHSISLDNLQQKMWVRYKIAQETIKNLGPKKPMCDAD